MFNNDIDSELLPSTCVGHVHFNFSLQQVLLMSCLTLAVTPCLAQLQSQKSGMLWEYTAGIPQRSSRTPIPLLPAHSAQPSGHHLPSFLSQVQEHVGGRTSKQQLRTPARGCFFSTGAGSAKGTCKIPWEPRFPCESAALGSTPEAAML